MIGRLRLVDFDRGPQYGSLVYWKLVIDGKPTMILCKLLSSRVKTGGWQAEVSVLGDDVCRWAEGDDLYETIGYDRDERSQA